MEDAALMQQAETQKLRFGEKLGYGLGDTASNFFFATFNIFLLYYYTDIFGLTAAAVGTMFLVMIGCGSAMTITGGDATRVRRQFRLNLYSFLSRFPLRSGWQ